MLCKKVIIWLIPFHVCLKFLFWELLASKCKALTSYRVVFETTLLMPCSHLFFCSVLENMLLPSLLKPLFFLSLHTATHTLTSESGIETKRSKYCNQTCVCLGTIVFSVQLSLSLSSHSNCWYCWLNTALRSAGTVQANSHTINQLTQDTEI